MRGKIKLSALVNSVNATGQEIVITKNGRPVVFLLSPDELKSWEETVKVNLIQSWFLKSKNGLKSLRKKLYSLEELFS